MPLIMSSIVLFWLYQNLIFFEKNTAFQIIALAFLAILAMGLALIPTSLVALISGYFWGWAALPILVISYILATCIGFFVSRRIDNEQILQEINKNNKAKNLLRNLKADQFKIIVLARLSPIFPFGISNVIFTYLGVPLQQLIFAGIIGMLPRTVFMVWVAQSARSLKDVLLKDWQQQLSSPIFLIGVFSMLFLGTILYKAYKKAY